MRFGNESFILAVPDSITYQASSITLENTQCIRYFQALKPLNGITWLDNFTINFCIYVYDTTSNLIINIHNRTLM